MWPFQFIQHFDFDFMKEKQKNKNKATNLNRNKVVFEFAPDSLTLHRQIH